MEFVILIGILLIGIVGVIFYRKQNPLDSSSKNYYYKRLIRNKQQAENHIQQLMQIIALHDCGDQYLNDDNNLTIQAYLLHLQNEFQKDYPEAILKKIKKNKLKHKDKKVYAKMVLIQSEKLYHVEADLALLNVRYPITNYTLV